MTFSDALPVQFWLNENSTYNELSNDGVHYSCFCHPWRAADSINIQFQDNSLGDFSLVVKHDDNSEDAPIAFGQTSGVYFLSFTPSDYSITDEQIQLLIKNDSNETILKSDCLDIQINQPRTVLIEYYDTRNYACLFYENTSPDQTFAIRVPAVFFHDEFPEEDEIIELIDTNINTASQVKTQRLLEFDFMPYYMHYKMKLILKHKFIAIDSANWVKEEKYEVVKGNKRWPKKPGSVLLTKKASIVRNVL